MKILFLRLLGFFLLTSIIACVQKSDETVSRIMHGSETEYLIHLNEVKDSLSLNFSDFIDEFQIVPLESNENCVVSKGKYFVTEDYILVQKRNHGILQFDKQGKFIRLLARFGSGPTEYVRIGWTVDEKTQILYLADRNKRNYLLQFNLHSGEYLGDLKKAIPCKSTEIILTADNELAIIPHAYFGADESPFFLYRQNLEGDLIKKLVAPPGWYNSGVENTMFIGNGYSRYQFHDADTVSVLRNNQFVPYLRYDFGEKNPQKQTVGFNDMRYKYELKSWIILQKFTVTGVASQNGAIISYGDRVNYILNKKEGKVYYEKPLYLNPTHHTMPPFEDRDFKIQSNRLVFFVYEAFDLLEQAEKALEDPNFKNPYRSKLEAVVSKLGEEDNPVLFIGRLSK